MSDPRPPVTRDEAVAIAAHHLDAIGERARPWALDPTHAGLPRAVLDADVEAAHEWGRTAKPQLSGIPLDGTWLVYCDRHNGMWGIRDSFVVVVSKRTGAVLYAGDAADEG